MISSCRRTRRWFGANPPGRSLTAKLSFSTQVKFRGRMPAPTCPSPCLHAHTHHRDTPSSSTSRRGTGPTSRAARTLANTSWTRTM